MAIILDIISRLFKILFSFIYFQKKLDPSVDREKLNDAIVNCLLKLDTQTLSWKQFEIEYVNEYLKMQSIPTLDYHGLITIDPIEYSFNKNKNGIYFNHDVMAGLNHNEGTYFAIFLYLNIYYDLNGFINQSSYDFNNEFVTKRLAEVLKTTYPSNEYENIMTMNLNSNANNLPSIKILSDENYNHDVKKAVENEFLNKYARFLLNYNLICMFLFQLT